MKKGLLCLTALLCLCLLTACSGGDQGGTKYEVVENNPAPKQQNLYQDPQPAPVQSTDFDSGAYDPMLEEEGDDEQEPVENLYVSEPQVTVAPTMHSEYAGATPVIIDPIDKPTPTPLPKLSFTYTTYNASRLHLTFEGPEGWTVDDSLGDTYVLTSNDDRAGYRASVTLRAFSVNENFTASEMKTEVKQTMNTIASDLGLKHFSATSTGTRTILGKSGTYANYTGTTPEGWKIAGRVHMLCLNKTMYLLHASYPEAYRDTYVDQVYHKVRNTLKIN